MDACWKLAPLAACRATADALIIRFDLLYICTQFLEIAAFNCVYTNTYLCLCVVCVAIAMSLLRVIAAKSLSFACSFPFTVDTDSPNIICEGNFEMTRFHGIGI